MNLDLSGKNALVCGGSKGIGRAAALELAALGANITLVARSTELLGELISQLDSSSGQQHGFFQADFMDPEGLKNKLQALVATKTIHILVNNAGGPPAGPALTAQAAQFLDAFQLHLLTNHLMVQALAPGMKAAGYGRIINVISTSVKAPIPNLGVSNTIRGAVANWAKTLATELGPDGITVNNVLPGYTETERLSQLVTNWSGQRSITEEELKAQMKKEVPLRRFAAPSEIGGVIAFLASPAAGYITGTNITVDGGRTGVL
ncbi:MAG: SDR family oxidoreductase [Saprospiraceae bacterium]